MQDLHVIASILELRRRLEGHLRDRRRVPDRPDSVCLRVAAVRVNARASERDPRPSWKPGLLNGEIGAVSNPGLPGAVFGDETVSCILLPARDDTAAVTLLFPG